MRKLFAVMSLSLMAVVFCGCLPEKEEPKPCECADRVELKLRFTPMVGAETLRMSNNAFYPVPSPNGDSADVRAFQYYLSNVQLVREDGSVWEEADSYHFVRHAPEAMVPGIKLKDVPEGRYTAVKFSFGLDSVVNSRLDYVGKGDLSVNNGMNWNWNIGYKFLLWEGNVRNGSFVGAYVVHIGFNNNRKDLSYALNTPLEVAKGGVYTLEYQADVVKLLNGQHPLNIRSLGDVMDNGDTARMMADNYATMLRLVQGN